MEEDRIAMKNQLIGAVLSSSGAIQAQLSETIGVIGHEDFPQKWPSLLPDLIERMAQMGANLAMVRGVLYTAHSLFKRYRHECRSNELFSEIKLVIGQFGAPLLHLTRVS
ncbi:unnamed protein product [Protopolystoma xenopodis]|uniref:Exportin-2 central domain-containing protein n=1 Tax=Protopolystoma xenopodis TaxID=117903 RepID=A0A3S5ALE4_9PLAT|nr:unnamed protein product [Protopolystoma xenopodis]